jgi:hypothetical protein
LQVVRVLNSATARVSTKTLSMVTGCDCTTIPLMVVQNVPCVATNEVVRRMKKPHYTDHCLHLTNASDSGVFVGTTVSPINGHLLDVYIWTDIGIRQRQVCIRYDESGEKYIGCHGTPEEWSNPKREVQDVNGDMVLASCFDGPAMELVRAFLVQERKSNVREETYKES